MPASPSPPTAAARDPFWDVLKGGLILLVVWGHIIQYQSYGLGPDADGVAGYLTDPVFKLIYLFHMPLFMAVAGFLFAHGLNRDASWSRAARTLRRLVIPTLAWFFILKLLLASIRVWQADAPLDYLQAVFAPGWLRMEILYHAWFVWCVVGFDLLFLLLRRLNADRPWVVGLLVVASCWLPDVSVLFLAQFTFPYFCLGVLLARTPFPQLRPGAVRLLWWFSLIAIPAYLQWTSSDYAYLYNWSVPISGVVWLAMKHLSVTAMVVLVFLIFRTVYPRLPQRGLVLLGRQSLPIYLVQGFLLASLPLLELPLQGTWWFSVTLAPLLAFALTHGLGQLSEALSRRPRLAPLLTGRSQN